jgi:hypothetical protein
MGKRTRKRQREDVNTAVERAEPIAPPQAAPRWGARLTRLRLDDHEWQALRDLAAAQGIPVSELLGRIVRRSLANRGARARTESPGAADTS